MLHTMIRAIESNEAQELYAAGLRLVSTERQLQNGTIALAGAVNNQPVSYRITAAGNVTCNGFKAVQSVTGTFPLDVYRNGLKATAKLLARRA